MKEKWNILLRWWLLFVLVNLATMVLFLVGQIETIYALDITKISFLIFGLFYVFSVRQGIMAYKVSRHKKKDIHYLEHSNETGWFVANMLLSLGMIGTVIGFIYMLGVSFTGLQTLSIPGIQSALLKMSTGMSTALYTTAVGLICSLLLRLQLFDLSQYIDKIVNENTKNIS